MRAIVDDMVRRIPMNYNIFKRQRIHPSAVFRLTGLHSTPDDTPRVLLPKRKRYASHSTRKRLRNPFIRRYSLVVCRDATSNHFLSSCSARSYVGDSISVLDGGERTQILDLRIWLRLWDTAEGARLTIFGIPSLMTKI